MKGHIVKVRLYRRFDSDLIALYTNPNFPFHTAVRSVLTGYAAGERVTIHIPAMEVDKNKKVVPVNEDITITLTDEQYSFLSQISSGLRNSFIKNLLRSALDFCPLTFYMESGEGSAYTNAMLQHSENSSAPFVPSQKVVEDSITKKKNSKGHKKTTAPKKKPQKAKTEQPQYEANDALDAMLLNNI